MLQHFQHTQPTRLLADASRLRGLGYALMQLHEEQWKLVQCISRFLSDAETRYAPCKLEMLAICWAAQKCKLYLHGLGYFDVITDHRPQLPILNTYTLDQIDNPRLQRLKQKLAMFTFTAIWNKGQHHIIQDVLSRAPIREPGGREQLAEQDLVGFKEQYMIACIQ